jgi:hypothetical protein
MRSVRVGALLAAVVVAAAPARGAAQRQAGLISPGNAVGLTGDLWVVPGFDGYSVPMATLRVSQLRPAGISPEFALGLSPQVLLAGGVLLLPDLDVACTTAFPGVDLVVSAGGSAVFLLGPDLAGGVFGVNGGVSALIRIAPRAALRIGATYRPFLDEGGVLSTLSLGVGFTSLPGGVR